MKTVRNIEGSAGTLGACTSYMDLSLKGLSYRAKNGILGGRIIRNRAVKAYYKNPNRCILCNEIIKVGTRRPSEARRKKFCNHSCAAKYHRNRKGTGDNIYKYDWVEVQKHYNKVKSYRKCKEKFGFASATWNHAVNKGFIVPIDHKIPLNKVLVKNSSYHRGALKRRLLKGGLLKNECDVCGLGAVWHGKKLVLVIDHINGVNNDHRIENLRMICPNCDSQSATYCGRNVNK